MTTPHPDLLAMLRVFRGAIVSEHARIGPGWKRLLAWHRAEVDFAIQETLDVSARISDCYDAELVSREIRDLKGEPKP
jgi:hypothetical protein